MKKILFSFFVVGTIGMFSCKKNITDLNTNPTRPAVVPSAALFTNAAVNLSDVLASTNVNNNNFRLFSQYWTETIYRDETRYNLNGRAIPDRWWATFYRDIIKDLTEASRVAETETVNLSAEQIKNRKAINEILIVYGYYHLLASFGNIPYTDALDINNLKPKYDDASEVFDKILTRLNAAMGELDEASGGYGSTDVINNDDMSAWLRFANSLKMKMGMLIIDADFAKASSIILEAAPNVAADNSENIVMNYLAAPPNTNPVWEDLIQSGRHDFVAAKPFMDTLIAKNDPRITAYFNEAITAGNGFVGQNPGNSAVYNNFSGPSSKLSDPQFPFTFFSYAEMEFYKAEAAEKGIAVGGTAAEHYNNAIDASILEWGGTQAQADEYRAQPSVNYATAAGSYKQKIGVQSWIGFYNRGFDAWTQWRRLDYPVLQVPFLGAFDPFANDETPAVITRLTYPVVEQNLNKDSYNAASGAIGKDQITQKLWFDKL